MKSKVTTRVKLSASTGFNDADCTVGKDIHNGLLANGWALAPESNAKSINWATDTFAKWTAATTQLDPASGSTWWNLYYLDDALHSTLPIYLAYGWIRHTYTPYSSPQTDMAPFFHVSSLTNGAGVPYRAFSRDGLGATFGGRPPYVNGMGNGSTTWNPTDLCFTSGDGYSGLFFPSNSLIPRTGSDWNILAIDLMVARTTDSAGAPTAEGYFAHGAHGYGSDYDVTRRSYFHLADPVADWQIADLDNSMRLFSLNYGPYPTSKISSLQTYRVQAVTPLKTFVDESCVIVTDDMVFPSTVSAKPKNVERVYMPVQTACTASNGRHAAVLPGFSRIAFRWE